MSDEDNCSSSNNSSPGTSRSYYNGSLAGKKLVKPRNGAVERQHNGGGGLLPTLHVAIQLSPLPVAGLFGWGGVDDAFSRSLSKAQAKIKIVEIMGPPNEQPLPANETLLTHMRQQRLLDVAPTPAPTGGRQTKAARMASGSPRTLDTLAPPPASPHVVSSMGLAVTCTGTSFLPTKTRRGVVPSMM